MASPAKQASVSSPTKASPDRPMTEAEAKETVRYLEESQLPSLLEDFTVEVARRRPADVVAFMAKWAQERSNRAVLSHSNTLIEESPKKPVLLALLGLEDRDDALEDLDVEEEQRSQHLKNHVKLVRSQLKNANVQSYSYAALESENYTFVIINLETADAPLAPGPALLNLLNLSNGIILKVSCEGSVAVKDLAKKREGLINHQVLAAHACQVQNAMVLLTGYRSATEDVVEATIAETEGCLYTSGYKRGSAPILRLDSAGVDPHVCQTEFSHLASTLPFVVPKPKPRYYDHSTLIEAKLMVLNPDGLSVGESLPAFCKTSFHCRIDAIIAVLDKATGQIKERKPFFIKAGDLGLISVSMVNDTEVVQNAPLIITRAGKVAAFGHITQVETDESEDVTTDQSDFNLSEG